MKFFRRRVDQFLADPASIRHATMAIVSTTLFVVLVGAIVIRIFDREEYPTFGGALWFTLQTVTTVGYGDATPERIVGRIVAAAVMMMAIGLLTVITAAITSAFIKAARAEIERSNRSENIETMARLEASMTSIADRLERLESTLAATTPERSPDDRDD